MGTRLALGKSQAGAGQSGRAGRGAANQSRARHRWALTGRRGARRRRRAPAQPARVASAGGPMLIVFRTLSPQGSIGRSGILMARDSITISEKSPRLMNGPTLVCALCHGASNHRSSLPILRHLPRPPPPPLYPSPTSYILPRRQPMRSYPHYPGAEEQLTRSHDCGQPRGARFRRAWNDAWNPWKLCLQRRPREP